MKYEIYRQCVKYSGYLKSKKYLKVESIDDEVVDFVVSWVDNEDPEWVKKKNAFSSKTSYEYQAAESISEARYRKWDNFKYWFRSVEKYAPWVNHIYLVTEGHLPSWIKGNTQKLTCIKHEDFIPDDYLPTFNANTIELNLHRIPGISEHFVYFNDDVFLTDYVNKTDFFVHGMPKHVAIAEPIWNTAYNSLFNHMLFNDIGLINDLLHEKISHNIRENSEKWFSSIYTKGQRNKNLIAYDYSKFIGLDFTHLAYPLCKSSMTKVWELAENNMKQTCYHRFRSALDYSLHVMVFWDIANGCFVPANKVDIGKNYNCSKRNYNEIIFSIMNRKYKQICINDNEYLSHDDYIIINKDLNSAFQEILPKKSSMEL